MNTELKQLIEDAAKAQADRQEPVKDWPEFGTNSGHGHVWERPDGLKMRCGGPGMCEVCSADFARLNQIELSQAVPKQEPVKDAPVAWRFSKGTITKLDSCPHGGNWQPLYTRPQPDLTAEVERLKLSAEHWNRLYREKCQEFHDAQANKGQEIVWLIDRIAELEALVSTREYDIRTEKMWVQRHAERIAELEEAARQARDAFEQHDGNYKLSKASGAVVEAAIAKLDAVLGNAD